MNLCHRFVASLDETLSSPTKQSHNKCKPASPIPTPEAKPDDLKADSSEEIAQKAPIVKRAVKFKSEVERSNYLTKFHQKFANLNKSQIQPTREPSRAENVNAIEITSLKKLKIGDSDVRDFAFYKCNNLRYPASLATKMASDKPKNEINSFFEMTRPYLPKKAADKQFIQVDPSHFTHNVSNALKTPDKTNLPRDVGTSEQFSDLLTYEKTIFELTQKMKNSAKIMQFSLSSHSISKTPPDTHRSPLFYINKDYHMLVGDYIRMYLRLPKMQREITLEEIKKRFLILPNKDLLLTNYLRTVSFMIQPIPNSPCFVDLQISTLPFIPLSPKDVAHYQCLAKSDRIWTLSVDPKELINTLNLVLRESEVVRHSIVQKETNFITPFIPYQLAKKYSKYCLGIGVVCQLFSFLFVKLFINDAVELSAYTSYQNWFLNDKSIAIGDSLITKIESCHEQIGVCFKKFKNAFPSIISAAACISARHKCDTSEKDKIDLVTRGRANLFPTIEKAKLTVKNAFSNEYYPPLLNLIEKTSHFRDYLNEIITSSIFGIFKDPSQHKQYKERLKFKTEIMERVQSDLTNLKELLNNDGADDSCFAAFKICFSFSEFFAPRTFTRCLLTVRDHLDLILQDLTMTKEIFENDWLNSFNQDTPIEKTIQSANSVNVLTNDLQLMYDNLELWLRSSHSNVFIHYAQRMLHGLRLYCEKTRDFSIVHHQLTKPMGSKNEAVIQRSVIYTRVNALKKRNEVIILSDSEEGPGGANAASERKRIPQTSSMACEEPLKRTKHDEITA